MNGAAPGAWPLILVDAANRINAPASMILVRCRPAAGEDGDSAENLGGDQSD